MKVGDKVIVKSNKDTGDYSGPYSGTIAVVVAVHNGYVDVELYDDNVASFPVEYLSVYPIGFKEGCTCGASFTAFQSFHYDWCNKYVPPIPEVDDEF